MTDELWKLTARAQVALLREGEISPSEAVAASLTRIEAVDDAVNAIPTRCAERALAAARRMEAEGPPATPTPGYLHGLPIAIKDLADVAGVRTTLGSPIFADRVPETSDILVRTLEANGAIVIGKSNTPEFGAGANTFNEVFGATRNPWDTRMTCGGSSGGAAVALATGQVALAHGSDLGGSLRIPGAFCGIVGYRPSPGRVAWGRDFSLFDTLSVHGPMARTVADVALMLDAMAGADRSDPVSLPPPERPLLTACEADPPPMRIAWSPTLGQAPVDPEVARITEAAARRFGDLGARVEAATPDFSGGRDMFQALRAHGYVLERQPLLETHRDQLKPEVIWNIEKGMQQSAGVAAGAERERGRLYHRMVAFFEDYDILCCPTVMAPPFPVETRYLSEVAGTQFDNYVDWLMLTYLITLTSCPAVSLPCGLTASGLPVGLQLVAPPREDAALLAAARHLEGVLGLADRVPFDPIIRHDA